MAIFQLYYRFLLLPLVILTEHYIFFFFWTTETLRNEKNGYLVKKILLPEVMISSRCRNVNMKLQNNKMQGKNWNLLVGNK